MKYLKSFNESNSRRNSWRGFKLGDKILEDTAKRMHDLPGSQAGPPDGLYTLMYIDIDKTDIVIEKQDTRDAFEFDNYDGYQTKTLDYMVKNLDELPPIIFIERQDGTYEHIDGHHRIVACKEIGRTEILAFIKEFDQSGEWVNSHPEPRVNVIKEFWEINMYDESKWNYFYGDKKISKSDAVSYLRSGKLKVVEKL